MTRLRFAMMVSLLALAFGAALGADDIYDGPEWFPAPPEPILFYVIEHPGPVYGSPRQIEVPPLGDGPGTFTSGSKSRGRGAPSLGLNSSAAGLANASLADGGSLVGGVDPGAVIEDRIRDARRRLDG